MTRRSTARSVLQQPCRQSTRTYGADERDEGDEDGVVRLGEWADLPQSLGRHRDPGASQICARPERVRGSATSPLPIQNLGPATLSSSSLPSPSLDALQKPWPRAPPSPASPPLLHTPGLRGRSVSVSHAGMRRRASIRYVRSVKSRTSKPDICLCADDRP